MPQLRLFSTSIKSFLTLLLSYFNLSVGGGDWRALLFFEAKPGSFLLKDTGTMMGSAL